MFLIQVHGAPKWMIPDYFRYQTFPLLHHPTNCAQELSDSLITMKFTKPLIYSLENAFITFHSLVLIHWTNWRMFTLVSKLWPRHTNILWTGKIDDTNCNVANWSETVKTLMWNKSLYFCYNDICAIFKDILCHITYSSTLLQTFKIAVLYVLVQVSLTSISSNRFKS